MKKIHFVNLGERSVIVYRIAKIFGKLSSEFKLIYELFLEGRLLPNHCGQNARILMFCLNEYYGYEKVKYVEGYAVGEDGEKIAHCWNLIDGKYFDFTLEIFGSEDEYDYFAKRIFTQTQVAEFGRTYRGMCISFAGCPDESGTYKEWFDNSGKFCRRHMSIAEKFEFDEIHMMAEENAKECLRSLPLAGYYSQNK